MISQAYIFGALGKAAFKEQGKWFVLDADEPDLIQPWHSFVVQELPVACRGRSGGSWCYTGT